jgi:N-acetylneuraminic acid mutarotase
VTRCASCSLVVVLASCVVGDAKPAAEADASAGVEGSDGAAPTTSATTGDATSDASDDGSGRRDAGAGDEGSDDGADGGTGGETPVSPDGAWHSLAPMAGGPRQEIGVAAVGTEVFAVGGITPQGMVARVEAYDPRTDAWRSVADFPVAEVHHANTAGAGGRLWVTGFLTGAGFVARGEVFAYDPAADAWTAQAPMPAGTERGAAGVAVDGEAIVVLGGSRDGPAVTDASMLDTASGTWSALPDLPAPRDHLVAAVVDGRIYAIGGRNANIAGHVARVDVLEPGASTWSEGPPMPTSRGGMAAAVVGPFVFVAGGEGNPDAESGVFAAFEVLDTETMSWTALEPMPTPRHGTGAATLGGAVLVPGGADRQQLGAVATHEAWVLEPIAARLRGSRLR